MDPKPIEYTRIRRPVHPTFDLTMPSPDVAALYIKELFPNDAEEAISAYTEYYNSHFSDHDDPDDYVGAREALLNDRNWVGRTPEDQKRNDLLVKYVRPAIEVWQKDREEQKGINYVPSPESIRSYFINEGRDDDEAYEMYKRLYPGVRDNLEKWKELMDVEYASPAGRGEIKIPERDPSVSDDAIRWALDRYGNLTEASSTGAMWTADSIAQFLEELLTKSPKIREAIIIQEATNRERAQAMRVPGKDGWVMSLEELDGVPNNASANLINERIIQKRLPAILRRAVKDRLDSIREDYTNKGIIYRPKVDPKRTVTQLDYLQEENERVLKEAEQAAEREQAARAEQKAQELVQAQGLEKALTQKLGELRDAEAEANYNYSIKGELEEDQRMLTDRTYKLRSGKVIRAPTFGDILELDDNDKVDLLQRLKADFGYRSPESPYRRYIDMERQYLIAKNDGNRAYSKKMTLQREIEAIRYKRGKKGGERLSSDNVRDLVSDFIGNEYLGGLGDDPKVEDEEETPQEVPQETDRTGAPSWWPQWAPDHKKFDLTKPPSERYDIDRWNNEFTDRDKENIWLDWLKEQRGIWQEERDEEERRRREDEWLGREEESPEVSPEAPPDTDTPEGFTPEEWARVPEKDKEAYLNASDQAKKVLLGVIKQPRAPPASEGDVPEGFTPEQWAKVTPRTKEQYLKASDGVKAVLRGVILKDQAAASLETPPETTPPETTPPTDSPKGFTPEEWAKVDPMTKEAYLNASDQAKKVLLNTIKQQLKEPAKEEPVKAEVPEGVEPELWALASDGEKEQYIKASDGVKRAMLAGLKVRRARQQPPQEQPPQEQPPQEQPPQSNIEMAKAYLEALKKAEEAIKTYPELAEDENYLALLDGKPIYEGIVNGTIPEDVIKDGRLNRSTIRKYAEERQRRDVTGKTPEEIMEEALKSGDEELMRKVDPKVVKAALDKAEKNAELFKQMGYADAGQDIRERADALRSMLDAINGRERRVITPETVPETVSETVPPERAPPISAESKRLEEIANELYEKQSNDIQSYANSDARNASPVEERPYHEILRLYGSGIPLAREVADHIMRNMVDLNKDGSYRLKPYDDGETVVPDIRLEPPTFDNSGRYVRGDSMIKRPFGEFIRDMHNIFTKDIRPIKDSIKPYEYYVGEDMIDYRKLLARLEKAQEIIKAKPTTTTLEEDGILKVPVKELKELYEMGPEGERAVEHYFNLLYFPNGSSSIENGVAKPYLTYVDSPTTDPVAKLKGLKHNNEVAEREGLLPEANDFYERPGATPREYFEKLKKQYINAHLKNSKRVENRHKREGWDLTLHEDSLLKMPIPEIDKLYKMGTEESVKLADEMMSKLVETSASDGELKNPQFPRYVRLRSADNVKELTKQARKLISGGKARETAPGMAFLDEVQKQRDEWNKIHEKEEKERKRQYAESINNNPISKGLRDKLVEKLKWRLAKERRVYHWDDYDWNLRPYPPFTKKNNVQEAAFNTPIELLRELYSMNDKEADRVADEFIRKYISDQNMGKIQVIDEMRKTWKDAGIGDRTTNYYDYLVGQKSRIIHDLMTKEEPKAEATVETPKVETPKPKRMLSEILKDGLTDKQWRDLQQRHIAQPSVSMIELRRQMGVPLSDEAIAEYNGHPAQPEVAPKITSDTEEPKVVTEVPEVVETPKKTYSIRSPHINAMLGFKGNMAGLKDYMEKNDLKGEDIVGFRDAIENEWMAMNSPEVIKKIPKKDLYNHIKTTSDYGTMIHGLNALNDEYSASMTPPTGPVTKSEAIRNIFIKAFKKSNTDIRCRRVIR